MGNKIKTSNLFLIGFSGSGKSIIGKYLSSKIKYNYIDTDRVIENITGEKISSIISQVGELEFRKIESKVLFEIDYSKKNIIATGGGTPTITKNVKLMRNKGSIVWLNASIETVYSRLNNSKEIRPLIGNNVQKENVKTLFNSRKKVYEIADTKIDTNKKSIEKIIEEIIDNYEK